MITVHTSQVGLALPYNDGSTDCLSGEVGSELGSDSSTVTVNRKNLPKEFSFVLSDPFHFSSNEGCSLIPIIDAVEDKDDLIRML